MEICIISLIEDTGCINLRYLSSYIRSKGHTTKLIFLPRLYSEGWGSDKSYKYPYSQTVLIQLKELCSTTDIIGISLMSCHFDNAVHITKFLKDLNKPIIWGGIHPTISPYECLEYADLVCVGEGENSIVELLNYMQNSKNESIIIPGILADKEQEIAVGKKIENLNELRFPDYEMDHQYVLYKNNIVKLNNTILSDCFSNRYRTSFSRGCVSSCTYCCNNILKKLYGNKTQPIRWRSIDNQINELKWAKSNINNLKQIEFSDDTFLSRPYEQIEEFALKYKKEIGLPFILLSTPLAISYDKLKILTNAGMNNIGIGIQTVYEPVRKMYKRNETIEQIINASKIISKISKENNNPITVRYDFITDNPWGREIDTEENIRFAMTLEKPRHIRIFSLLFYHGTELYEIAKKEGLIKDELNEVYRTTQLSPKPTYMNAVFLLLSLGCPESIIKILINKKIKTRSVKFVKLLNLFMHTIRSIKKLDKPLHEAVQVSTPFNGPPGEVIKQVNHPHLKRCRFSKEYGEI